MLLSFYYLRKVQIAHDVPFSSRKKLFDRKVENSVKKVTEDKRVKRRRSHTYCTVRNNVLILTKATLLQDPFFTISLYKGGYK